MPTSSPIPLVPVPIPDAVAGLIGSCMPRRILQAEIDADVEAREALRFRAPLLTARLDDEDQQDRESALARLAWNNKLLAAYNPGLIVTPKQVAR